jgi:hypothetical protein
MTKTSMPFDTNPVPDEDSGLRFYHLLQTFDGVDAEAGDTTLQVTQGTGLQVSIAAGTAWVRGTLFRASAAELIGPGGWSAPSAGQTRRDRIVLQRNPTGNITDLIKLTGTATTGTPADPALTQSSTGTWEIPLASVLLDSTGIVSITDQRQFLPHGAVVACTSINRPPHWKGRVIYETDTANMYVSNGTTWKPLLANAAYANNEKTSNTNVAGGTDIDSSPVTVLTAPAVASVGGHHFKITLSWPQLNINESVETSSHTLAIAVYRGSTRIGVRRVKVDVSSIQQAGDSFTHLDRNPPLGSLSYSFRAAWGGATTAVLVGTITGPVQIMVEPFFGS